MSRGPSDIPTTMTLQVSERLGSSSTTEARKGSPAKYESPKGPGYLTLLFFLWNSYLLPGQQSFHLFFHKNPQALTITASVWSLSKDKHNRVSLIILDTCPWDGSHVGPVIGWTFSQSLVPSLCLHYL
ncbi:hypothetical protein [Plasmodium yoelii yoelii]|uniref:Uncharacterized protein n=1 Tax=Plasmodium yoelii yoelii TaxID=73239 RepID=Q7RJT5_PLAYO|nr:hypothetical protein [Plasmodium yoelii yoelii]